MKDRFARGEKLFTVWCEAKGDWTAVIRHQRKIMKTTARDFKRENYFTKAQLLKHLEGDGELLTAICKEKEARGKPHCIPHLDAPNSGHKMYLCVGLGGEDERDAASERRNN